MCAIQRVSSRGCGEISNRSSTQVFDYERSLARVGGDPTLFAEIVLLFLEDSPGLLESAVQAQRQNDLPTLERAAHSVKGLAANFDAAELISAAAMVEQYAHQRDQQRAQASFADMERELSRLQDCLRDFLQKQRAEKR